MDIFNYFQRTGYKFLLVGVFVNRFYLILVLIVFLNCYVKIMNINYYQE